MDNFQPILLSLQFMTAVTQLSLTCVSKGLQLALSTPEACGARCLTWCGGNTRFVSSLRNGLQLSWSDLLSALRIGADIVGDYRILDDHSQLSIVRAFGGGLHCLVVLPPGLDVRVHPCPGAVLAAAGPAQGEHAAASDECIQRKHGHSPQATYTWAWSLYPSRSARGTSQSELGSTGGAADPTALPAPSTQRDFSSTTGSAITGGLHPMLWSLVTPADVLAPPHNAARQLHAVELHRRTIRASLSPSEQNCSEAGIVSDVWALRSAAQSATHTPSYMQRQVYIRVDSSRWVHPKFSSMFETKHDGPGHTLHPALWRVATAPGYTCSDYGGHGVEIQRATIDVPDDPVRQQVLLAERAAVIELAQATQHAGLRVPETDTGRSTAVDALHGSQLTCADVSLFTADQSAARSCYFVDIGSHAQPPPPPSFGDGSASHAAAHAAGGTDKLPTKQPCLLLHKVTGDCNVVPGSLTACVPVHREGVLAAAAPAAGAGGADDTAGPALRPPYSIQGTSFGTLCPEPFPAGMNDRPRALSPESQSALLLPVAQDALLLRGRALVAGVREQLALAWPTTRASSIVSRCLFPIHSWHCAHGIINYQHGKWAPRMEQSFLGIGLQHRFWRDELRSFWTVEADAIAHRSQHWTFSDAIGFASSPEACSMAAASTARAWQGGHSSDPDSMALRDEVNGHAPFGALFTPGHDAHNQSVLVLAWMGDHTSPQISHSLIYFPLSVMETPCMHETTIPPEVQSLVKASCALNSAAQEGAPGPWLSTESQACPNQGQQASHSLQRLLQEKASIGVLDGAQVLGLPDILLTVQSLRG